MGGALGGTVGTLVGGPIGGVIGGSVGGAFDSPNSDPVKSTGTSLLNAVPQFNLQMGQGGFMQNSGLGDWRKPQQSQNPLVDAGMQGALSSFGSNPQPSRKK